MLAIGLIIRFALAPLSSWSTDTPGFLLGDVAFVFHGSPYASAALFNPPVTAFLTTPFVAILLLFSPPQSLITYSSSLVGPASAIGSVSPWLPSGPALLAIKTPLILADLGTALVLIWLVNRSNKPLLGPYVGAAYFLNPLVIWVSSVHAEPDGLAALFVVLFIAALLFERTLAAGVFLALGIFTKVYPLVLLPLGLAYLISSTPNFEGASRLILKKIGLFAAGILLVTAIFLPYLGLVQSAFSRTIPVADFGGVSVLAMYNVSSPPLFGATNLWRSTLPARDVLLFLEILLAASLILATFLILRMRKRRTGSGDQLSLRRNFLFSSLLVVTGLLMALAVPQTENVVAVLPLTLLVLSYSRKRIEAAYWIVSAAAMALYLSYSTPFQPFYPLFVDAGPTWVSWANSVVIAYANGGYWYPPGFFWIIPSLVGGTTLIWIWWTSLKRVIPERWTGLLGQREGTIERTEVTSPH